MEGHKMFDNDSQVRQEFLMIRVNGSTDFSRFVYFVLNEIFNGTLTHEKLMSEIWLENKN